MYTLPVEVPHANRVARSSVEHRACWVEGDLVDLALALRKGYGAGGGARTDVARNHLPRGAVRKEQKQKKIYIYIQRQHERRDTNGSRKTRSSTSDFKGLRDSILTLERLQAARNSRERAHALGRVADVPNLDVGGGNGENQAGGRTILDRHHIVRVALEGDDLLTRHQVPHLASAIWRKGRTDAVRILMSSAVSGVGKTPCGNCGHLSVGSAKDK